MYPNFQKDNLSVMESIIEWHWNCSVLILLFDVGTAVWFWRPVWLLLFVFSIGGELNCLEGELMSLCSKYCNKLSYWLLNLYKYASMPPETEILLRYKKILSNNTPLSRISVHSVLYGDWRGSVIQVVSIDTQTTASGPVKSIVEENR